MSPNFGIIDIPALAKLTWELHNQCHFVVKDAPDGFRSLMTELRSLQGALRTLSDDVSSNTVFFERMNEDRRCTLERCLNTCFKTLRRLKDLLARYRELGLGDGKLFWQKIKWATQRTQIEDIRSKIMVHTCNLSLCMSSIGNSSLARIERTMMQAMEEDEQALLNAEILPGRDADSIVSPLSSRGGFVGDYDESGETEIYRQVRARIAAQHHGSRGASRARHVSTSSESAVSGSDGSFYGRTCPTSPISINTTCSPAQSMIGRTGHTRVRSDQLLHDGSIDSRTLGTGAWDNNSDIQERQSAGKTSETSNTDFGHSNVMEAVNSAMQQLRQVRLQEQLSRPIRFEPQDQLHRPDHDTLKAFEASANDELRVRRLTISDWLQVATWWLLKARVTLANCNRHIYVSARGSFSPSTNSRSTGHQAYVDILKASFILYDIVLKDESSPVLLTDENRKSIADLSEGINEELSQYTTIDIPEPSNLQTQNLDIWEPLQPGEAVEIGVDFSFRLKNSRWIAVDQDDAGDEEEKVLYRTFVNAGIGSKKFRMRTKGAPYMVLLATREGESEPKIVLCNQSGSLCLQRNFVFDDLLPLIQLSNTTMTGFPGTRVSEPVLFKFDNLSVSISFQFEADLGHFINIPKTYFEAVWQREPMDSSEFIETVIFKSSVDTFEQLKSPNMKPMNPPVVARSCEVRILERSFGEAWQSIRRLVVSPSATEKSPRSLEFFMPLSQIQLSRDDVSRHVLLQWSDTCQERTDKTDGNYNTLHSYVYDASAPNLGAGLVFRTQQAADDFERAVLDQPGLQPAFAWSQPTSSGRIYDVVDTGIEHKQYKAVVLFRARTPWRSSDLYYLYRDADYAFHDSACSVRFPRLSYADYISSHVDQLFPADRPVTFTHCEKKFESVVIDFASDPAARAFLSALSPLYDLLFARRVPSLSTKTTALFGPKKSGKGPADLQLWRRGSSFQLAARWADAAPDKWLTLTQGPGCADAVAKDNPPRVYLPRLPYARGMSLDLVNIIARSPKATSSGSREGAITIAFGSAKDQEEFLAVLQGKSLPTFIQNIRHQAALNRQETIASVSHTPTKGHGYCFYNASTIQSTPS